MLQLSVQCHFLVPEQTQLQVKLNCCIECLILAQFTEGIAHFPSKKYFFSEDGM